MAKIPKTEIGCLCSFHNILFTNKIKSLFDVTVSLYLHIFIYTISLNPAKRICYKSILFLSLPDLLSNVVKEQMM